MLVGGPSSRPNLSMNGPLLRLVELLAICQVFIRLAWPISSVRLSRLHIVIAEGLGSERCTILWDSSATDNIRLSDLHGSEITSHNRCGLPHVILRLDLRLLLVDIDETLRSYRASIRSCEGANIAHSTCAICECTARCICSLTALSCGDRAMGRVLMTGKC